MSDVLGPAITAMSSGLGAFGSFMPRLGDVHNTDPNADPVSAADIRHSEVVATVVTVGVGVILSALTGSNVPVLVAAVVALGLVIIYESSLRSTTTTQETTA